MIRMINLLGLRSIIFSLTRTALFIVSKIISSFKFSFALISLISSASFAVDDPYAGGYLGARLGYSYNRHSCVDLAIECNRSDSGYGLFAGYDFDNQLSVEISATRLGDTSVVYPDVTLRGEIFTADLSLKYTHQLSEKINLFGKLGVTYWEAKIIGWDRVAEDSGQRPVAGLGIKFPLFVAIDGRLDYQYFDRLGNYWMGYTDAHFFSFSLVWNFSKSKKYSNAPSQSSPHVSLAASLSVKYFESLPEEKIDQYVESVLSSVLVKQ